MSHMTMKRPAAWWRRGRDGRTARAAARVAPSVEGLEARGLLSVSIAQFPLPASATGVSVVAAGPDGDLWFNDIDADEFNLAKIDPTTHVITEYPLPASTGTTISLAGDPNGSLYALTTTSLLQVDTATGAMTTYPIPAAPIYDPNSLAVGPGGNLWFSENTNNIAEFNVTTHAVTQYPVPTFRAGVTGITAGPDGGIWFAENDASKVGRLDPTTGAIAEFPTPTPEADPREMTVGPDGEIWFTETLADQIAEIDPTTHVITEYPLRPVGDSYLAGITKGPDGNIWFADADAPAIREFDVQTHVFTSYPLPKSDFGPGQIVQGADGNLWFAEDGDAQIDVVTGIVAKPTPGPVVGTQTRLVIGPDPSTAGDPVVLTAIVVPDSGSAQPGGDVVFTVDGVARPPVPLALVGGQEQASLTLPAMAEGSHTIVATYEGGAGFSSSTATATATATARVDDPPSVVSVKRYGIHRQPTTLVVTFSAGLDPAHAQDVHDYRIVRPNGRSIAFKWAVYDPATRAVTLRPRARINLHRTYHLEVSGSGPAGLAGTDGVPLDGDGRPGTDYTTTVNWRNVVLTPAEARKYLHPRTE